MKDERSMTIKQSDGLMNSHSYYNSGISYYADSERCLAIRSIRYVCRCKYINKENESVFFLLFFFG